MDELTQERIARNDATFRAANERIAESAVEHEMGERIPFICECADPNCTQIVRLSLHEYEAIRKHSRHFLNVPGHQVAAGPVVQVVADKEDFVVVEKLAHAGEVAERLDERNTKESDEQRTG
jgi:hypothetical protein